MAVTVLSSAVTEMVADAATTAVSGLSFYYSSAAATALFSVATAVDVITLDVDANLTRTHKKRSAFSHSPFSFYSPAKTTSVSITAHGTI